MIAVLRKQGLKVGAPQGMRQAAAASAPAASGDPGRRQKVLSLILDDDDQALKTALTDKYASQVPPRRARPARRPGGRGAPAQGMPTKGMSGKAPAMRPGEPGWHYLQRLGSSMFGLRNDPGNSQTNGGRHTAGSEHYSNRAIDFGNARNSRSALNAWKAYAASIGLDVLDEGDHIHVSLPGGGT